MSDAELDVGRVRAYFAPGDRMTGVPALFDASALPGLELDAPPAPWVELGAVTNFTRRCGSKVEALVAGAPGFAAGQVRTEIDAEVLFAFERWGKVQMALSCGAQEMNVLAVVPGAAAAGSGGTAIQAVPLAAATSSATAVDVGTAVGSFAVGQLVTVDVDFAPGTTGYVGAGLAGGYVRAGATIADVDYVRRVSWNVGRIAGVSGTVLELDRPLLAGAPVDGMKVSRVLGFCDREGGTFFQEWAGLFVWQGAQGDRVAFVYPRLQTVAGACETQQVLGRGLETVRLGGRFRALPVVDPCDGERVVCFRTYVPAAV